MTDKLLLSLALSLVAVGLTGCQSAEKPKLNNVRKPVDMTKPLAPQLFPAPATNNAWYHVISASDELKFNPEFAGYDAMSDFKKSDPMGRRAYFAKASVKALVSNLVSVASLTATSPRTSHSYKDTLLTPPDYGRFRAVARFLTAAMVCAIEQKETHQASEIAAATLKLVQGPSSESNAGIATSLACEILLLTELCRVAGSFTSDDLEVIASNQLLPSALNKSRFTSGLRSDYVAIENLLASDDFVDVLASQMVASSDEAVIKKKVTELKTNPDQVGISRQQVKMHARMCEQTLMHVVGQPSEFMRTRFNPPPKETYGIVELMQAMEGTNAASVVTSITLTRAAGLYLNAVAAHKRTGTWPTSIEKLGSAFDVLEPLSGRPLLLAKDPSGGVRIRASKGLPFVFGVCGGELSVGSTIRLDRGSTVKTKPFSRR